MSPVLLCVFPAAAGVACLARKWRLVDRLLDADPGGGSADVRDDELRDWVASLRGDPAGVWPVSLTKRCTAYRRLVPIANRPPARRAKVLTRGGAR